MKIQWTSKVFGDLSRLDGFEGREVRRLLIGRYEIRYELTSQMVYILRIWHTREAR